jgi:hypothetical protein
MGLGRTRPSHFGLGRNWSGLVNSRDTLYCSRGEQWRRKMRKKKKKKEEEEDEKEKGG